MNGALNEHGGTVMLTERRMVMEGTPGMVTGLRTMLKEAHIDDSDIRTEKFAGY